MKGFILGGCSAGGGLAAGLSIRVRDAPSFSDTRVTGLYLAAPVLAHINANSQFAHFSCQVHHCADNRTRFPNELLSLEQNKDAPFMTKEIMVWSYGKSS